jgi:ankyrin repeat protein
MPKQFRSLDRIKLDRIKVESPCDADWDSMIGNDKVRFCEHCNLHVNDLSAGTRAQAMRLISRSEGRLCVRYVARPGEPAPVMPAQPLFRLSRRASRFAAGAFTAALGVASAAAQTRSPAENAATALVVRSANFDRNSANEKTGSLSGVITDPAGALVPGVTLTLVDGADHTVFTTSTNDVGSYSFPFVDSGTYSLTVEGAGFQRKEMLVGALQEKEVRPVDITMELPELQMSVEVKADEITVESFPTMGVLAVRAPEEPLVKAAYESDLAAVKQLAFTAANVDIRDKHTDMTALAYAVENGNYEIVRTLLAAGANVKTKNSSARTALMYLRGNATEELVRALLTAGSKLNAHDESGETALMNAAESTPVAVVRVLLEAGAKIGLKDDDGKTALMYSAANQDPKVARLLIEMGADVNFKKEDGETALIIAAEDGSAEIVKALIEAGAEVNASDEAGYTPLINAAANGNLESVRLLLNAGADLNARNTDGKTALALARQYEAAEVVNLLKARGAPE